MHQMFSFLEHEFLDGCVRFGFTPIQSLKKDGDFKVDIYDAVLALAAYDSVEGDSNWNPLADLASPYGIINIYDMVMLTYHYGKQYN